MGSRGFNTVRDEAGTSFVGTVTDFGIVTSAGAASDERTISTRRRPHAATETMWSKEGRFGVGFAFFGSPRVWGVPVLDHPAHTPHAPVVTPTPDLRRERMAQVAHYPLT